jgi:rod shape determining protein RodA
VRKVKTLSDCFPLLVMVGIPFLLIAKQPDLGTALVFMFLLLAMLLFKGENTVLLLLILSPVVSLIVFYKLSWLFHVVWVGYLWGLWWWMSSQKTPWLDRVVFLLLNVSIVWMGPHLWHALKPYQQERLMVFIDPSIDPLAQGIRYHIDKSMIAIGSGGIWGEGWMKGALSHLQYIPVQKADFIFSVVGEEFGFIGCGIILFFLVVIIARSIRIAMTANDSFGSLLALGIAAYFLFQAMVNIGMATGIMPVVGIPLPFVSFGGSALVTNMACVGLLESITCRREKLFF